MYDRVLPRPRWGDCFLGGGPSATAYRCELEGCAAAAARLPYLEESRGRAPNDSCPTCPHVGVCGLSRPGVAAREVLIRSGRVVGGTVPYGWLSIPNPIGRGRVLARDPDRIHYVHEMAQRALAGETVYAICKWLDSANAPLPTTSQQRRKFIRWNYSTVERLLRNPVLAGMTPYNPGRDRRDHVDPSAVLRDEHGLPVIDESVAILTSDERRHLLKILDNRDSPQSRPRASKGTTSPLLSRLAKCGHCDRTMHRGTIQGRPALSCPCCHQTISRTQLDRHISDRLLTERGERKIWEHIETNGNNAPELGNLEEAIKDVASSMARDDADVPALIEQLSALKELRSRARVGGPAHRHWRITGQTVRQVWEAARGEEERRTVLVGQIARVTIIRGKVGRYLDPARINIEWRSIPEGLPLPDGHVMVNRADSIHGMEGEVGPAVVVLPDGDRLYASSSRF